MAGLLYSNFVRPVTMRYCQMKYSTNVNIASLGKKKKVGKAGATVEKKVLPVETDPVKLSQFVCGSCILKEGEDIKLKPDSEYPEWLWNLHVGKPKKLEEMDPETPEYWIKVRKLARMRSNTISKLKKF